MALASPDKWLGRAFRLAWFLHGNADVAREIVTRATLQLDVAAAAQGKRLYYQPTGAARSKVYMSQPHLLQRLVYAASETYEREREHEAAAKPLRQSDLLIYFIKHLVRITIKRNSFYVTLGLSRVLHNYTTGEAMEIYNLVVQDPERVHDDYYYRSRKSVLLKELKQRFAPFTETVHATRGEERFRARPDAGRLSELAQECLEWFTPWATPCSVPEQFDPLDEVLPQLHFTGRNPDEEHRIEVNRIHAILHPECFNRLTAANGYAPPDERLEIPLFSLAHDDDANAGPPRPPDASDEDLAYIKNSLGREEARRKAARCGVLRVLADGVEQAQLDATRTAQAGFAIDEGVEMIEVYGRDAEGELLLAAYLPDWNAQQQTAEMVLADGKKLSFAIQTRRDKFGFPECADVSVACRAIGFAPRLREFFTLPALWKPALAFGMLALLSTVAWFAWSSRQPAAGPIVKNAPTPTPEKVESRTPNPTATPETSKPKLEVSKPKSEIPDSRPTPAPSRPPVTPKPKTHSPNPAPESVPLTAQRDKPRPDKEAPRDEGPRPQNAEATRGVWDVKMLGLPLSEIKLLTVQAANAEPLGQEVITALNSRLSAAGPSFAPAPNLEAAEGALKISVRPTVNNGQIVVTVYLVNDKGRVVWPAQTIGSGRRYTGTPEAVAAQIVADLLKAKR